MSGEIVVTVRTLLKRPLYTSMILITLALGIGANTAIFSLVETLLLRPLPYPAPDRLVRLYGTAPAGASRGNISPMDFLDWQLESTGLAALTAYATDRVTWLGSSEPARLVGLRVTPGYLEVLGVGPAAGRGLQPEDGLVGAEPVILLSHGFWQSALGGADDVVGRALSFEERTATVIGIMPAGFTAPGFAAGDIPFWTNLVIDPARHARGGHWLRCLGRLQPAASLAGVQARLDDLMERLEQEHPVTNANERVAVVDLHDAVVGDTRGVLLGLMAAVGTVLLIACANVANLLLSRATSRDREMAVRAALGAGRGRLIRQVLMESLMLAAAGGGLGLLAATWGLELFRHRPVPGLPDLSTVGVDPGALLFTGAVSLATGLLFGLVPAWRAATPRLRAAMDQGRSPGGSAGSHRLRRGLVVAETALALVLLTAAGLATRSVWNLAGVEPGFAAEGAAAFRVALPSSRYPDDAGRIAFTRRLENRLAALPGARAVGAVNTFPLSQSWSCDYFHLDDRPPFRPDEDVCAEVRSATTSYLQAMSIPLLSGRTLAPSDGAGAEPVVVINQAMARRFWPDGDDPVGKRMKWGPPDDSTPWRRIVGVVGDVRHYALDREAPPEVYMPYSQATTSGLTWVIRTQGEALESLSAVRAAVAEVDDALPVTVIGRLEDTIAAALAPRRRSAEMVGAFALLAALLAAVGTFGVLSYAVSERRHDFGVRMVLGAGAADIYGMVLRQGLGLALFGAVLGVIGSLALSRLTGGLYYGVSPRDPLTLVAMTALLVVVSAAACIVPAWRAARVDPARTMRHD